MKIYVHGNCQAPALADLLASACPDVEAVSRQVYSIDIEAERDAYLRDVAEADVILTQPVADGYRGTEILSTSWLRNQARPDATFLVFPVAYHRGQLPQCFTLADHHHGRLAYHDAHALDFFLRGMRSDDFVAATSNADFLSEEFVYAELARTTVELLRRERAGNVDILVSDIIASQLELGQPLYTVNHPSRHVLAALANRVLARLGRSEQTSSLGVDMLDLFVMPPYLSTLLALGHGGQGIWLNDVRADGRTETRASFFAAVFEEYDRIGAPALRDAVGRNAEMMAYLGRFQRSSRANPTFDRAEFVDALYRLFFGRAASSDETLHHLQTAKNLGYLEMMAAFPSSEEFRREANVQSFLDRFGEARALPRPFPNYRIPHPSPPVAAPVVIKKPISRRIRTAVEILLGNDKEAPASPVPLAPSPNPTPTATEIVLEVEAKLPEIETDIDYLSQPEASARLGLFRSQQAGTSMPGMRPTTS